MQQTAKRLPNHLRLAFKFSDVLAAPERFSPLRDVATAIEKGTPVKLHNLLLNVAADGGFARHPAVSQCLEESITHALAQKRFTENKGGKALSLVVAIHKTDIPEFMSAVKPEHVSALVDAIVPETTKRNRGWIGSLLELGHAVHGSAPHREAFTTALGAKKSAAFGDISHYVGQVDKYTYVHEKEQRTVTTAALVKFGGRKVVDWVLASLPDTAAAEAPKYPKPLNVRIMNEVAARPA